MTDGSASADSEHASGHGSAAATSVVVTIPADAARLPVLRSVAAALAVSSDFDIDTMADLRMAVDELAATVVTRARPGSRVGVEFVADGGAVIVRAFATTDDPDPIDGGSFGWMVLTTLSESVSSSVEDTGDQGLQVRMSLVVRPRRAVQ